MRGLLFLVLGFSLAWSRVHTVPIEPYEIYKIKSSVAGWVLESHPEYEGRQIREMVVVRLDDRIDRTDLAILKRKEKILKKIFEKEREALDLLRKLTAIKERGYQRIKDLSTKSKSEKDRRLAEFLSARQTFLAQGVKVENLKLQMEDLRSKIAKLEDLIRKKNPKTSGYVYRIHPRKGDFVAAGAPLVDVADVSRGKVVLYLAKEEVEGIENKKIYIDGKESNATLFKLIRIPDERHLGEYRAEIVLPRPELFGKFIKVEIK
ncbi:MAG: hypothetical protein GXO16_02490 [Epsilonproteobacteria bacterium]|nr:hypothetical protein [Campylobacterota bacterium]